MLQIFVRIIFTLALLGVSMSYVEGGKLIPQYSPFLILGALALAILVIAVDATIPRKSLQALSGVFFGLLTGMVITLGLTIVLDLLVSAFLSPAFHAGGELESAVAITKVLLGIICCYLCVSFVLQTKDDVRFVIPYVEFSKQIKGQHPLILDTSVIIDGRIADICNTGIIDQKLIVPRFVLVELQTVADSSDKLKRIRGRRGLDVLHKLQTNERIDVEVLDARLDGSDPSDGVDLKLLTLAQRLNGRVATNDFNLNKVAKLRGVDVININELANALKPVVLPGEGMSVKIIKPGEEPGQGVGYLDDGTMVVVEQARNRIQEVVDVLVTSVYQTSAGKMIFGRINDEAVDDHRRRGPAPRS